MYQIVRVWVLFERLRKVSQVAICGIVAHSIIYLLGPSYNFLLMWATTARLNRQGCFNSSRFLCKSYWKSDNHCHYFMCVFDDYCSDMNITYGVFHRLRLSETLK
jgi:hypothetical protein